MHLRVQCSKNGCTQWMELERSVGIGDNVLLICTRCEAILRVTAQDWEGAVYYQRPPTMQQAAKIQRKP